MGNQRYLVGKTSSGGKVLNDSNQCGGLGYRSLLDQGEFLRTPFVQYELPAPLPKLYGGSAREELFFTILGELCESRSSLAEPCENEYNKDRYSCLVEKENWSGGGRTLRLGMF